MYNTFNISDSSDSEVRVSLSKTFSYVPSACKALSVLSCHVHAACHDSLRVSKRKIIGFGSP